MIYAGSVEVAFNSSEAGRRTQALPGLTTSLKIEDCCLRPSSTNMRGRPLPPILWGVALPSHCQGEASIFRYEAKPFAIT